MDILSNDPFIKTVDIIIIGTIILLVFLTYLNAKSKK